MPRAGEGRSIRINPEVYEALLALKRGNMTFSDVIEQMLHECYGWSDAFPTNQRELGDFPERRLQSEGKYRDFPPREVDTGPASCRCQPPTLAYQQ